MTSNKVILTSVDSDELVQPPYKPRNSKCCLDSSLTVIEYSSDQQRLWSDCAYAQAGLSICCSHIPHCWKSDVAAQYDIDTISMELSIAYFKGSQADFFLNHYAFLSLQVILI